MLELTGHQGSVHALEFTPDAQSLISAGKDGTIRLWDVVRRRERALLNGHNDCVYCLALHGDGRVLASGGRDCSVLLWDLKTAKPAGLLAKQIASVTGLAWLPQQRSLAVTCGERLLPDRPGELRLWNLETSKSKSLRLSAHGFWSLTAAPGPMVAYSGGAREISLWRLTLQEPRTFKLTHPSLHVALSPTGNRLAAAVERTVCVWDTGRRGDIGTLTGHKGMVAALAFSPDGRILATGGRDKAVCFWSMAAGPPVLSSTFHWSTGAVTAIAFSADGLLAAAAGENGTIIIWDVDL